MTIFLIKHLCLHDAQFGFLAGHSTESAIFNLNETLVYYLQRKIPVYGCFLHLSKAFDLVSYQALWDKLQATRKEQELVDVFMCWCASGDCVRWSDEFLNTCRPEWETDVSEALQLVFEWIKVLKPFVFHTHKQ